MIEDKEALIIDPTLTSSYQQLADIAYQNKDLNLAIDYNKQAFKIEQNNSLWPLALAQLYLAKGEKITALSYATIAKDLEPANEQTAALIKKIESSK
jgi:tetratricopeptide (TPR) repeat protein